MLQATRLGIEEPGDPVQVVIDGHAIESKMTFDGEIHGERIYKVPSGGWSAAKEILPPTLAMRWDKMTGGMRYATALPIQLDAKNVVTVCGVTDRGCFVTPFPTAPDVLRSANTWIVRIRPAEPGVIDKIADFSCKLATNQVVQLTATAAGQGAYATGARQGCAIYKQWSTSPGTAYEVKPSSGTVAPTDARTIIRLARDRGRTQLPTAQQTYTKPGTTPWYRKATTYMVVAAAVGGVLYLRRPRRGR